MGDSGGKAGQANLGLNLNKKEEDLPQQQSKKYQTFMNNPEPKSVQKKIQLLERPRSLVSPFVTKITKGATKGPTKALTTGLGLAKGLKRRG